MANAATGAPGKLKSPINLLAKQQPPPPKRRQPSNPGNAVAMVAAAQGVPYWTVMDKLGRVSRLPMRLFTLDNHEAYMAMCAERRKGKENDGPN